MGFDEICLKQAEVIDNLSNLCNTLIQELAQYKNIELEEKLLKEANKYDIQGS